MDSEQKLQEQVNEYANLGKHNPNVDVSMLMLNALRNQNKNMVSSKAKRWAFGISLGLPPLGFLAALKYYFSSEDDARQVANICVILTILSLAAVWLFAKMVFSGSGANLQQIEQIKPSDIQQLTQ